MSSPNFQEYLLKVSLVETSIYQEPKIKQIRNTLGRITLKRP